MNKIKSFQSQNKERMCINVAFLFFIFFCFSLFLFKCHSISIFDTDDWAYLMFTRRAAFFPSVKEWNPIKILPENLMPLASWFGYYVGMMLTDNLYDSIVLGMNVTLALFVSLFCSLCMRAIKKILTLNYFESVIIGLCCFFFCFIPCIKKNNVCYNFFWAPGATIVFNYAIPTLFNCLLVFLSIIHEDKLKCFFKKKHIICKVVYLILIYLAIYSNLYSNVVLASYAGVKILQYLFVENKKNTVFSAKKWLECSVYIYTLVLFFFSLIFEANGGRAKIAEGNPFCLKASIKMLVHTFFFEKNVVFNVIIFASVVFYFLMLIRLLCSKLFVRIESERMKLFKVYVNYASLCFFNVVFTMAYLVLLSGKVGARYLESPSVQLDYYLFFLLNILMVLGYFFKYHKRTIHVCVVFLFFFIALFLHVGGKIAEYNVWSLSNRTCKSLFCFIIQQYVEADEKNKESVSVRVPFFNSSDNYPIANYGGPRLSKALYKYGLISKPLKAELVIDKSVNELFGIKP